ncbi:MAG: hypothetical protein C4346_01195 [Chloroflexota bacterium]
MEAADSSVFDDLLAQDVRRVFAEALAASGSPEHATASVLHAFADSLPDPEEGPTIWLALAMQQVEHGCLTEHVLHRALEAMDADLVRWAMEGPEALARRQQVLASLRSRLIEEAEQEADDDWK